MALFNSNADTAKTFLEHAHKIFTEKDLVKTADTTLAANFNSSWALIYSRPIPADKDGMKKFADELVTMSSLVFLRAMRTQEGLQKLDGVAKQVDTLVTPGIVPTSSAVHTTVALKKWDCSKAPEMNFVMYYGIMTNYVSHRLYS